MGVVMTPLARILLGLLFVTCVASPASAQLDLGWPPDEETADEAWPALATEPAPAPEAEPAQPERPPLPAPKQQAEKRRAEPEEPAPNPPPGIARRPIERLRDLRPPQSPEERTPLLILFLTLLGLGLALFAAERARSWIKANVPLTRVLGGLVLILRLAGAGVLVAIVLELIPEGQDWLLWSLLALLLVVGWSVRDLFADVVAGAVLAAERRVKKGVWVSGDGFQGTVEARTLRATWLRDGQGHRLTVPNRSMVGAPMVYDAGADTEHEVVVRLEGYEDAGKVRMALTDAILSSPWVLAGANPVVLRDPADPVVWRVRTKLLEPRFSVHFEGELLERVEDLLRYEPPTEERETVPSSRPPSE